jgi:hypothetical protein
MERLERAINRLEDDLRDHNAEFAAVKAGLEACIQDLGRIFTLVRDGDGQPSLVHIVSMLKRDVLDIFVRLEKIERSSSSSRAADIKGRWQLYTALTVSVLSGLGAVLVALLK